VETSKKYSTGLLADSPTVEQAGEEEAIGEHYTEQTTHGSSGKPQKAQSRRKSKPYKVEIRSSVSKEYFVDDEELDSSTSSRGRKIKRKTPHHDGEPASKKPFGSPSESPMPAESPSGVGIFSFEMPTEFHSNLHQLAMASQLVSQSPSGEIPRSVIKAIENGQKSQKGRVHEKPESLPLSIPRSPLISVSRKHPGSTPVSSLEFSTSSCAAIPSPVIVSHRSIPGKVASSVETPITATSTAANISSAVTHTPGSPDSNESVFTYPTPVEESSAQLKSTSTPTIVRVVSGPDAVAMFSKCDTSAMSSTKTISSSTQTVCVSDVSSQKSSAATSRRTISSTDCPPPVTVVTKPNSLQVRATLVNNQFVIVYLLLNS